MKKKRQYWNPFMKMQAQNKLDEQEVDNPPEGIPYWIL